MRPGLAGRLSRVLVGCHPRRWRERYGEEMLDVLDQHQADRADRGQPGGQRASARTLDPAYRTERLSLSRLRRAALISAAIAAPLALVLGPVGYGTWQDSHWHPAADEPLETAAFSPHAGIMVTAFGEAIDGTDMMWDVTDLSLPRRLSQFEGGQPVALSPDGRTVATITYSGQTAMWNVANPRRPVKITTLSDGDGTQLEETRVLPGRPDPGHRPLRPDLPVGHGQPCPAPAAAHAGRPGDVPGRRRHRYRSASRTSRSPPREHPGQRHRHRPGHLVERDRPGARLPHGHHRRRGRLHPGLRVLPPREPAGRRDLPRHRAGLQPGRPGPPRPHRHGPRPADPRALPERVLRSHTRRRSAPPAAWPATRWRSPRTGTP